ncbi:GGDEF and PAS domains-containing protein [Desulfonema limicola]|uniref:GGDEF and PAS domains-containing protein n=1 Tax=Desulfonema limicola TaxID=45656 RepID=A0A975B6V6_9BACT|nr:sensor domain-containing diguanylate cyclase [Desulfonema limicola]QTA79896.1 GGDEF and PAS domains-containing protein [Desulfonema limicola]
MNQIPASGCKDILENIADGVRIIDKNGHIVYANEAYCRLLGYDISELKGKSLYDLCPVKYHPAIEKSLSKREPGQRSCHELEYQDRKGNLLYLKVMSIPMFDNCSIFKGNYAIVLDITDKKRLENELVKEKEFFNGLVTTCPDSIIGINRQGIIIIFNKAAEKLLGYKAEEVIGKMSIDHIYGSVHIAKKIKKYLYSDEMGPKGQLEGMEVETPGKYGKSFPIRLSATLLFDSQGRETGSVGFFHDLTASKQMEAKLRELSIKDSLSGLYNQRHFYAVLSNEINRCKRNKNPLSLICFDLDNFKQCNDTLGHLEGDNIIRMAGKVLEETLRTTDFAFRYGGDEFMVILPETSMEGALFSSERIRDTFNSRWFFNSCKNENLIPVTLSMGVAEIADNEIADTFIKRADLAMYEAKRGGGNKTVEAKMQIGKHMHNNDCC